MPRKSAVQFISRCQESYILIRIFSLKSSSLCRRTLAYMSCQKILPDKPFDLDAGIATNLLHKTQQQSFVRLPKFQIPETNQGLFYPFVPLCFCLDLKLYVCCSLKELAHLLKCVWTGRLYPNGRLSLEWKDEKI